MPRGLGPRFKAVSMGQLSDYEEVEIDTYMEDTLCILSAHGG